MRLLVIKNVQKDFWIRTRPPFSKQRLAFYISCRLIACVGKVNVTILKVWISIQYSCYAYSWLLFKTPCVVDGRNFAWWMLIYIFLIQVVNYMHGCWKYSNSFLGAFTKLRKATMSFMSVCLPVCSCVCPSVCPSVSLFVCQSLCLSVCLSPFLYIHPAATTRLPYNGFSWNFIFVYFSKICRENSSFI